MFETAGITRYGNVNLIQAWWHRDMHEDYLHLLYDDCGGI